MRKISRSISQNKDSKEKSTSNTSIGADKNNDDKSLAEEQQISRFHTQPRNNIQTPFRNEKTIVRFNFGTGVKFVSYNDPKKKFAELGFSVNNSKKDHEKTVAKKTPSSNIDEVDDKTLTLVEGQTGEEDEERIFDSSAILYRLSTIDESNTKSPIISAKAPESPFSAISPLKKVQFQSKVGSRPSMPSSGFSSSTISRTLSSNIKSETEENSNDSATNKTCKRHYTFESRSNSTPALKQQFIEIGNGDIHLNKCNGDAYRLVMRRAQIGKVCLNMRVFKDMKPKPQSPSLIKFLGYSSRTNPEANDNNSDPQLKYSIFALRFKDEETQKKFLTKLTDAINSIEKK